MQEHSRDQESRSLRKRRTQPALPGATLPTAPIDAQAQRSSALPQAPTRQRPQHAQRAALKLLVLGLVLGALYLALYPLLIGAVVDNEAVKHALFGIFPWLSSLFWTSRASFLVQGLNYLPMFKLSSGASSTTSAIGYANLLLVLLALTFVLVLIAARVGSKVARQRLSTKDGYLLFWTIFALTGIFAIIFVFAPGAMSRDVFLYGSYGRMVTVYHVNPYVVSPTAYPNDLLYTFLAKGTGVAPYGPLWLDLTLPVAVVAHASAANIMIGFRLVGLLAHLANTALIWIILAKLKPEARLSGTLLYAWNPLVLLVGVCEMHYEVVVIFFLLLATFFLQRRSFLLSWVCLLLATLFNILCLVLLPLFLRLLWKESRVMQGGRRFLWWLTLGGLSVTIVVLTYAPYWRGWGLTGFASSLRRAFLPDNAINSLDAAIIHLPMRLAPVLSWIAVPLSWMILVALTVGILLLFGLWLADTLELVLLFSSWIFLAVVALLPINWPWYMLLPLTLAIISASRRTILLAMLLTLGAILEYYFWLWPQVWPSLALVTIGLPLVIWGWTLFFASTWLMIRPDVELEQPPTKATKGISFSRPSWSSRPSWPARRKSM